MTAKNYTKISWRNIKNKIDSIDKLYSIDDVKNLLKNEDYYKNFFGKSKNRTMICENPKLYKSILHYTDILKTTFKKQRGGYNNFNFTKRIIFIVEKDLQIDKLKCVCGKRYTWNRYCRYCSDYHKTQLGKRHTIETKKKQRISAIRYIKTLKGDVKPRYNKSSIQIIESYGKQYGYNFRHAENGGKFYIKDLGYFLDAYDENKNVVLEIDEKRHFDSNGNLKEEDVIRQKEIENYLNCKFIRIKI